MNVSKPHDVFSKKDWDLANQKFQIIRLCIEDNVQQIELAKKYNLDTRTLRRWICAYKKHGISGLVSKKRVIPQHFVSKKLSDIIEGLALKSPRLSVASIHRALVPVVLKNNELMPSYSTVRRIVSAIDPSLLELAHNGPKTYMDKYDLVYRSEADGPNAIWQADHTELDVLVKEGTTLKKPWLTIVLDDYSRAVAGYSLFFGAPSAIQTALAYRHAIWHKDVKGWEVSGIPDVFYTDHGSDFTSYHIEQLAISLKTRLIFSTVGQPRGRGKIERFFRSLSQVLLPTLPGYQPPSTKTTDKDFITLSQLAARLENYIVNDYHLKPHGTTKVLPQLRWPKSDFLPRMPDSLDDLDLLLLTVPNMRTVQKDGIRFSGFKYIHSTLAGYVGEKVVIRYDPRDLAEISVFHRDNFVCRAICTDLAGESVSLSEIKSARKRRIKEQKGKILDRIKATDDLLDFRTLSHEEMVETEAKQIVPSPKPPSKLKRYRNE